jgi:septal ring factor EnvC (AmiA/AmiB activator)
MDDVKYPLHVIEHIDNSQLTAGSGLYYDPTQSEIFCRNQIGQTIEQFRSERSELEQRVSLLDSVVLKQEKKQKDKEHLIEELQRTVKMLEKKERAQEKQLKVYRYRIGKRYNTRSGNK